MIPRCTIALFSISSQVGGMNGTCPRVPGPSRPSKPSRTQLTADWLGWYQMVLFKSLTAAKHRSGIVPADSGRDTGASSCVCHSSSGTRRAGSGTKGLPSQFAKALWSGQRPRVRGIKAAAVDYWRADLQTQPPRLLAWLRPPLFVH